MEITPQVLILVGIVCVVLGFMANLLLNTLHEDEGAPGGPGDPDAAPPGGKKGRYDQISQLWRERGTGRLIVEIQGKAYVNPSPLNEMQREELDAAAKDLRTWLGAPPETSPGGLVQSAGEFSTPVQAPAAAPAPPDTITPTVKATSEISTPPTPAREAQQSPPPAREIPPPSAGQAKPYTPPAVEIPNVPPVRSSPIRKGSQAGGEEKKGTVPSLSIVAQIDDVLQEMIAGTPLALRDIRLEEDPRRGVMVRVGSEIFEGIDSVTDPEVKAVIREAVVAWENGAWRFAGKK